MYVIMIAMVIVICNSLLSGYGILAESRTALLFNQIFYAVQVRGRPYLAITCRINHDLVGPFGYQNPRSSQG